MTTTTTVTDMGGSDDDNDNEAVFFFFLISTCVSTIITIVADWIVGCHDRQWCNIMAVPILDFNENPRTYRFRSIGIGIGIGIGINSIRGKRYRMLL